MHCRASLSPLCGNSTKAWYIHGTRPSSLMLQDGGEVNTENEKKNLDTFVAILCCMTSKYTTSGCTHLARPSGGVMQLTAMAQE